MAGEIFISYRRADEAWARLLHSQLRAEGIEAWYDAQVGPGQDWRLTTARALEDSKIFVLLFSAAAAESSDIAKELAAATHEKKLVVPVRLENISPRGAFLYELASRNWINAYENTEATLAELAKGLAHLVQTGAQDESALPYERPAARGKQQPAPRRWLGPAIIGAALAAIASLAVAGWLLRPAPPPVARAIPPPAGVSVAVLPFLNLSGDPKQEFFSDGMTEEITSALAKVSDLKVVARTSAFQFKGENKDVRAVGLALGATDVIEGSVRMAGSRVRITAQLIRTTDGTHLWTESYDRELKDVFAVQEGIARAIAAALQVPLGLKRGQNLVSNRTTDTNSYQDYLRARALFRARKLDDVAKLLTSVITHDPSYAPAWALLADTYVFTSQFDAAQRAILAGSLDEARRLVQSQFARVEKAAREAIRLDPRNAIAYDALSNLEEHRGNFAAAEDYGRQALALDPNDPEILYNHGYRLVATGRIREAMQVQDRILAQEPFVPVYRQRAADLLWALGRNDDAIKAWQSVSIEGRRMLGIAKAYATAGRYEDAANMILGVNPSAAGDSSQSLEDAARLLRGASANSGARDGLPRLPADLAFVYLFVGAPDRILELSEREFEVGYYGDLFRDPWGPPSAALRKTERFKDFVRKARLVEYWRARHWPDLCHPVGADDFACQ